MTAQALLLFGATGDLARRMLIPSLYALDHDGLLPEGFRILGAARSPLDDDGFRSLAEEAIAERIPDERSDKDSIQAFLARLAYQPLDVAQSDGFAALAERLGDCRAGLSIFLSTAPKLFEPTIRGLEGAGLTCEGVRIALEKPLGSDLESSLAINDAVAAAFPEERIFRIDHYLGKETVQNVLALRFANLFFEPLWNAAHIDHVEITIAENVGLEGRGDYYDGAGALRDMVQNHVLQLLALVAMEPPAGFDPAAVRDEKVKVLRALRQPGCEDSALGQYEGYEAELGRTSGTETFVALRAFVDNWRWAGVPFYLRTGKKLGRRRTEIVVRFKDVPHSIFADRGATSRPNTLVIAIQPEENIQLRLMAKIPGLDREGVRLREIALDIATPDALAEPVRRIAYERLMLDLIAGDQTLFVRRDEVEAQWRWIDGVRDCWARHRITPEPYVPGSGGPEGATRLIASDGRSWHG
jgi:glucose-6-phosphate 1-dehydrogenase